MRITTTIISIAAAGIILGGSPALAKEPASETLETITVTAQKQEENIQDVPISMSVYDDVAIQDRMLDTLLDVRKYTPGLDIISYGAAVRVAPSMRGIYADHETHASSVGVFVDGVPITDGTGADEALLDIERIEVLKGPQGTLYGKNTEVGAINIITRKPGNELEARATLELGEDNKRVLSAVASGPVVKDRLYIGVAGKHYEKDGFVENTFQNKNDDDREHNYGKVNLRWTPTKNLEASFVTSLIKYDNGGQSVSLMDASERKVRCNLDNYDKSEVLLSSLHVSYTFNDDFSLDSITAYRDFHRDQSQDWDLNEFDAYKFHAFPDSHYKTLSEEFRLNYEGDTIKAIAGIFLETGDYDENAFLDTARGSFVKWGDTDLDSRAAFLHLTYRLNDTFSVLGGLRYDTEDKEYKDDSPTLNYDEDEIIPKLGLTCNIYDNLMTYVTFSKGFRSGGFNFWGAGDSETYEPETLYSYEVGVKGAALDGRLRYDAAFYYMDIRDMQVDVYTSPTSMLKDNAAKATSKGFEAAVDYRIASGLSVFAGFSYNDISFDEYHDGQEDYSGNRTTYAPEYNFHLGALYRAANGLYASADISGYGKTYLDVKNRFKRDPYEVVNLKIGYEADHYDVYLYAKNLFDEEYNMVGVFDAYTIYSEPREIGLALTYRF